MLRKMIVLAILPLVLVGCKEDFIKIKVKYDQIYNLKAGGRVLFEQNHVGQVTDVFYSKEGNYLVSLVIQKGFSNAVTEDSRFVIITDPRKQTEKAIAIRQTRKGGKPLPDGAVVDGSTRSSEFFGHMREELDKGIEDLKERFEKFSEELKRVPESDDFKKLKKELDDLLEELKESGKSVKEKIEKQLLPQIEKEVEKLREKLKEFEKDKESEPADEPIQKTHI